MQIKITMRYYYTSTRLLKLKVLTKPRVGQDAKHLKLSYTGWEWKLVTVNSGEWFEFEISLKM